MDAEKKRNIKIGLFAIGAFAILCVGLNYLKGRNLFSSGATLTAHFANVDGLTDSSPVIFNGFKVGSVKDIDIDQYAEDPGRVFTVTVNIEKSLDVPKDSRAVIISTDLLGGKGIELRLGQSPEMASTGDSIGSAVSAGLVEELMPVKDKASALMVSADNVMRDLDTILDMRNRDHIDAIICKMARAMENIEAITSNLAKVTSASGAMTGTLRSADEFMASLNKQTGRIDTLLASAAAVSAELANAGLGDAVMRLDSLLAKTNALMSANGNIAQLANDSQLYENMVTASENLNRLLVDVRLNPSRYINISAVKFGGRQIYFSDSNTANSVMRGEVVAVSLFHSRKPTDAPVSIGGKKVLEYSYDGKYEYLVVPFATNKDAEGFISENNLRSQYPNLDVETFVDGKRK